MKLRLFFSLMLLTVFALSAPHAKAWGCADGESRIDVGKRQPSGTSGNGPGQWFLGTGTEGTKGDYYVCPNPNKPTDPTNTIKQKQQQNQNQTSTSQSIATAGANSSSASTATGGQSQSNATGGNAKATGGNVSESGNSANTYESNTNVDASRIPVNTAIALAPPSNLNCSVGYGAGAQTMNVGASLGFSRVNKNCELLTTSLTAKNRLTYCKIWVSNKYAKKAGVTLEDCLQQDVVAVQTPVAVVPVAPAPVVVPAPNVTVVLPAPIPAPAPVVAAEQEQYSYLGECTIDRINTCKAFINKAIQGHAVGLRVVGPREATFVAQFLRERHSGMRLEQRLSDDQNSTVTLYLLYPSELVTLGQ